MDDGKILESKSLRRLWNEAKSTTMAGMSARSKSVAARTGDPAVDDPKALVALAVKSFTDAKRAAIEENDRIGIPSYGAKKGKLTVRQVAGAKPSPR